MYKILTAQGFGYFGLKIPRYFRTFRITFTKIKLGDLRNDKKNQTGTSFSVQWREDRVEMKKKCTFEVLVIDFHSYRIDLQDFKENLNFAKDLQMFCI